MDGSVPLLMYGLRFEPTPAMRMLSQLFELRVAWGDNVRRLRRCAAFALPLRLPQLRSKLAYRRVAAEGGGYVIRL